MAHETKHSINIFGQGDSDVLCAKHFTPSPLPKILDIMSIPLSQGLYALVDGENYEWLMQWKWCAFKAPATFYAARKGYDKKAGKRMMIKMHREILGLKYLDSKMTDHRNHCGLDNRESNIRACTNQQNQGNSKVRKDNSSGYKGVCWFPIRKKWEAAIKDNGKRIYLGNFDTKEEAARVYDKRAREIFGEYAYLNFPI